MDWNRRSSLPVPDNGKTVRHPERSLLSSAPLSMAAWSLRAMPERKGPCSFHGPEELNFYSRSLRICIGLAFACASIATLDSIMIWFRVKLDISLARSASRTTDSEL